jgi:hypothetical protein
MAARRRARLASDVPTFDEQLPGPSPPADRRSVPIANEDRLVVADALGTTIKSTSMASLEIPACMAPTGYGSGQVL